VIVPIKKVLPPPPDIKQADPIPRFSVPVVAKPEPKKSIIKKKKKDTHRILERVKKKYRNHWILEEIKDKDVQTNQNYIDSDGKEQHFSLLEARLNQVQKKKGIKTRLVDFVSSCNAILKKSKKTRTFK
jgi:hypothetical protein